MSNKNCYPKDSYPLEDKCTRGLSCCAPYTLNKVGDRYVCGNGPAVKADFINNPPNNFCCASTDFYGNTHNCIPSTLPGDIPPDFEPGDPKEYIYNFNLTPCQGLNCNYFKTELYNDCLGCIYGPIYNPHNSFSYYNTSTGCTRGLPIQGKIQKPWDGEPVATGSAYYNSQYSCDNPGIQTNPKSFGIGII